VGGGRRLDTGTTGYPVTPGSLRGVVGRIVHHYQIAAELTGYVVTPAGQGWTLAAVLESPETTDAYLLAQTPLVFIAPHKRGAWRWPIESITVGDGNLRAKLGARLE